MHCTTYQGLKLDKVAGKTNRQYVADTLNLANEDGFNSANAEAKQFKSCYNNNNNVIVSFSVKIDAKQGNSSMHLEYLMLHFHQH